MAVATLVLGLLISDGLCNCLDGFGAPSSVCTDESSGMRSWDILSDLSGFHGNIIGLQDISKTEGSLSRREGPDD